MARASFLSDEPEQQGNIYLVVPFVESYLTFFHWVYRLLAVESYCEKTPQKISLGEEICPGPAGDTGADFLSQADSSEGRIPASPVIIF